MSEEIKPGGTYLEIERLQQAQMDCADAICKLVDIGQKLTKERDELRAALTKARDIFATLHGDVFNLNFNGVIAEFQALLNKEPTR